MQESEILKIEITGKDYPKALKKLKDAPRALYYQGTLPKEDELKFAIVGSRTYSTYGKQVTLDIATRLAEAGVTIVSGLAPGIDTFAHKAAVEAGKKTIAILGTGLDKKSFYPKENITLSQKILENGGCLLSEYEPGTPGSKFTFPRRNRIVSMLSMGVLVVEAKEKSGSLITARLAKQQGKKLFAVPGSIYSATSKGCNNLIQQGAILTQNANDILKVLKLKQSHEKEIKGENKREDLILEALKAESMHINKLIKITGLQTRQVVSSLAILEIKDKVRNLGQNTWTIS